MESGKIIVVANQKGGVAKTSTVRNLSYALAEMGKKVLVVDFDPQYNLTTSFGVLPTQAPYNTGTLITNLLLDESLPDTNEFIQKIGSVDLIPSSRSLTVAEANLLMTPDSNDYLAALLNPLRLSYDYIIVDTNPSLGSLTINALTAADEVIIPIDPELFALTGLQALVDTIKKIKRKLNPSIEIGGILFTKCNKRTNLYVLSGSEYKVNEGKVVLLREYTGKLTPERTEQILSGEFNRKPKKSTATAFKVKPAIYKKYFTASISQKEFDSIVDEALALYFAQKGQVSEQEAG